MAVWTALATVEGADAAQRLSDALDRIEPAGVGVFEIEDGSGLWEVGGYFDGPPDPIRLALVEAAHGVAFAVSEVPEIDWVAKVRRELSPVEAGRFFVHGSHDADRVPEGRIALLIEAAMAFGTGHHGTTLGCLRALDRLADRAAPGPVADVGCGTAVLAMAAARVWDVRVLASDIDEVAVDVAAANLAANGLADRVECFVAAGVDDPRYATAGPFGLIFANILMGPLIELAPDIAGIAAPGGMAILSGLLNEQAASVEAAYQATGFIRENAEVIGEWTTLAMRRAN